ncbi:MAG: cellulose binding domain-containing protein, partial [Cytophagales bacterium]|nr:cellulose binding domain-containing protein [Cytophagales bacterium]
MTLDNRSAWPARGSSNLSMRYYYTLDPGASLNSITIDGHDGNPAPTINGPVHVSGDLHYIEISWAGNPIYPIGIDSTLLRSSAYTPANTQPNRPQFHRRTIVLTLNHNAQWNNSNDWSFAGLISTDKVTQQIPIYEGTTLINGNEPGAYDIEVWYDVNNNNVLDVGTDVKLTGTNEVVDFGFIEPNGSVMRNVLVKNASAAPITLFSNWQLPSGFQRAGSGNIVIPGGQTRSITIEMQGIGNATLSGAVRIFNDCANTMENPIRINVRGVVGVAWNSN